MTKNYYFISDLHLGLESKECENLKEKTLENFLNSVKGDCDKLFILGDLFDYWFEYKRVLQKGYFRTFTALQDLSESGAEIHYLIGNHDFLHRDFFEKEIGCKVYNEELTIELDNKKFFLGHGDGLVANDTGYKILKRVLRNKFAQKLYSILHPDFGIWLASSTSKTSRDYTTKKNYGEIDGLFETAKIKIDQGYDYVIFGHSHNLCQEEYKNGSYINLGSWLEKPRVGKFSNNKFEIIDWKYNG
ncbi:MAG: UDP-2,3-diacylglucosamine diphosphatase [Rhodothermaceae bacterium]